MVPYWVVCGPSGDRLVNLPGRGKTYSPQEISESILASSRLMPLAIWASRSPKQ
jgi:hypothetical protein